MAQVTVTKPESAEFAVDVNSFVDEFASEIREAVDPDGIFSDTQLKEWVGENSEPEDVFSDTKLNEWAENNGYVKEE